MSRINWGRFAIGMLFAAAICFFSDGYLHERLVGNDWKAVYAALGAAEPVHNGSGMLYFVIFELGRGFTALMLYVLLRPRLGPGAKTATLAGFLMWIAFSITGPAQFIPLGFYSNALWLKVAATQLIASILAAVVGAAIYREHAVAEPATVN